MAKTVNIHEAKTHLSRLIEEPAAGEDVIIAKTGKPKVRLTLVEPERACRRLRLYARPGLDRRGRLRSHV